MLVACSADDAVDSVPVAPGVPQPDPVTNPADVDPFCRMMLELDIKSAEPPQRPVVIAAYQRIADDVPASIAPAFEVVLERLIALEAGGDVTDVAGAEEASLQVSAFVDMTCRSTAISPLPPATQPDAPD